MAWESDLLTWRVAVQSCLVLLASGIATFLAKLYRVRRQFQLMQKEGLVSPYAYVPHICFSCCDVH